MLWIMTEPTFTTDNGLKWYGPIAIKNVTQPWISDSQRLNVYRESGSNAWPWIEGCFLVGSMCTTQCKACFGYRTRSIPSYRSIPSVTTRPVRC